MGNESSTKLDKDQYEQAWDVLLNARYAMKGKDIPDDEAILAMADWVMISALASGTKDGLSELIGSTIIDRQTKLIEEWKEQRGIFKNKPRQH